MTGFWTIEFATTLGLFGAGVIFLFENGSAKGGDSGFVFEGTYRIDEHTGEFSAQLTVERFVKDYPGVFGSLPAPFLLDITGVLRESDGTGHGQVRGISQPRISIKLRKRY